MKHDEERYEEYLNDVMSGNSKINVTGILPHELVNYYLTNEHAKIDNTIESQWKTILQDMKSTELFHNLISVVDVSGSMFNANNGSIPAQVAIALGLLIAVIYIFFMQLGGVLASIPYVSSFWAIWFPNFIFSALGIVLYLRASK